MLCHMAVFILFVYIDVFIVFLILYTFVSSPVESTESYCCHCWCHTLMFYVSFFFCVYVMGKAQSGELSCRQTGLIILSIDVFMRFF